MLSRFLRFHSDRVGDFLDGRDGLLDREDGQGDGVVLVIFHLRHGLGEVLDEALELLVGVLDDVLGVEHVVLFIPFGDGEVEVPVQLQACLIVYAAVLALDVLKLDVLVLDADGPGRARRREEAKRSLFGRHQGLERETRYLGDN